MDRNNFEEYISAYLDNELPKSDREAFEEIISTDSDCNIRFEEVKKIVLSTQSLPELKTSDNFINNLYDRIDNESRQKINFTDKVKGILFPNQSLGFAMSIAGLFLISYMFLNSYNTTDYYSSKSKAVTDSINEDEIYLSDIDTTDQYDEYEGDILQTTGEE
tara:strand:+ start:99 stop:584 length:486 start_codon:yes stop_codon:yes gene_type:complete